VDAHQSGARDYSAPLWSLLMFEAFLRKVVDGDAGAATTPVRAATAEAVA
jgi:asparagine synthase (glutamine-hydrolysing)